MNKITHYEVSEYIYDTREEREKHVELMESQGWYNSGQLKRMKHGVSIMDARNSDYEYYGHFTRETR